MLDLSEATTTTSEGIADAIHARPEVDNAAALTGQHMGAERGTAGAGHTLRWLTGVVTLRGYTQGLRTQQKQNGNGVHTMSILRGKVRAVHVGDYVKNLNLDREYRCKRNSSCAKGGARGGTCCPPKCWRSPPTEQLTVERGSETFQRLRQPPTF